MGIIESLLGGAAGVLGGKAVQAPAKRGYFKTMTVEDGDDAYNTEAEIVALAPAVGVKMRIWEYTVPAQVAMSWGYGTPAYPANQGSIFFAFLLEGSGFNVGTVLLGHENSTRHLFIPIDEFNDTVTHLADSTTLVTARSTDQRLLRPLPEGGMQGSSVALVGQDSRITIDYTAIVLVAEDAIGFTIAVTVYD